MRILSLMSIFTHGLPSNTRGLCKEIYLQGNKCFEKRCRLNTNKKKKKKKKGFQNSWFSNKSIFYYNIYFKFLLNIK